MLSDLAPVAPELVARICAGIQTLTRRQAQVALAILRGLSNAEMGAALESPKSTLELHVGAVLKACGCTRYEFIRVCCVELASDDAVRALWVLAAEDGPRWRRDGSPMPRDNGRVQRSKGSPRLQEV